MARQQAISSAKEKVSESYQSEHPRVITGMIGRYVAVVVVVEPDDVVRLAACLASFCTMRS